MHARRMKQVSKALCSPLNRVASHPGSRCAACIAALAERVEGIVVRWACRAHSTAVHC